jgi:hypothetical protein
MVTPLHMNRLAKNAIDWDGVLVNLLFLDPGQDWRMTSTTSFTIGTQSIQDNFSCVGTKVAGYRIHIIFSKAGFISRNGPTKVFCESSFVTCAS